MFIVDIILDEYSINFDCVALRNVKVATKQYVKFSVALGKNCCYRIAKILYASECRSVTIL